MEFDDFLQANLQGLTTFAGVLVGERQHAHDVLVDALLVTHRHWKRIGLMEHPAAYVRHVITTTYLADRRRSARRHAITIAHPPQVEPTRDESEDIATRDELNRLLDGLPRRQRAALVLRYYLDLPDDASAEILHCSRATVRSHIAQGLRALRRVVDPSAVAPAHRIEPQP